MTLQGISRYYLYPLVTPLPLSLASPCAIVISNVSPLVSLHDIDAATANASMCPTANGPAGHQLEKSPNGIPAIEVSSPEDAPDAGLRSLDHCRCFAALKLPQDSIATVFLDYAVVCFMTMSFAASVRPRRQHVLGTRLAILARGLQNANYSCQTSANYLYGDTICDRELCP
jgi:hypothetical protein